MDKIFFGVFLKNRIAYLSSFPPRECGIATFTKNLVTAIDGFNFFRSPVIIAMNEKEACYNYGRYVKCEIRRDFSLDYLKAADFVNSSKIDLVNLQHEFGLFGGEWGEYVDLFLGRVDKPVVSTLHTLSANFDEKAQSVLKQIVDQSSKIVTMTKTATKILMDYGVSRSKIEIIPHGCPDISFVNSSKVKRSLFGLRGKTVLSTFGLLSRGKGIEYVIKALPEVDLELNEHVKFHNRFLSERELIKYLKATDVYVTASVDPYQISSGTLVYAMGAGRAIVATPYLHSKEALADGRGLFCEFKDSPSIAKSLIRLLKDDCLRQEIQEKVYRYSRGFTWNKVAESYAQLFRRIIDS
ncbi:MAG: glycosyltransferase family 4 protein [Candidatus Bathyarchaeota archaeon]